MKILVSLCENHYVRNFISTPALDLISKKYELYLIADERISDDQKEKVRKLENFKGFFFYENSKIERFNKLNILGAKMTANTMIIKFETPLLKGISTYQISDSFSQFLKKGHLNIKSDLQALNIEKQDQTA